MEEFDDLRRRYETAPRELDERLRARLRDQAGATFRAQKAPVTPAWTWVAIGIGAPLAGLLFYLLLRVDTSTTWLLGTAGALLLLGGFVGLMLLRGRTETIQPESPAKTEEQLILEQGPLVLAHLVRADERLWQPGAPPGAGALAVQPGERSALRPHLPRSPRRRNSGPAGRHHARHEPDGFVADREQRHHRRQRIRSRAAGGKLVHLSRQR